MSGLHPAALAAAAVLVLMGFAASRHKKPLRASLTSVLAGMGALGAVNMLAPFTGVGLALNAFTSFMAVVLGAPGVVTMLVLNLVFGLV
ncbi:pro-sigmaK processing inhibitor BofA family protein [Allofournierella sp.]|uniref:pro-sigmaK processing inhibitor BofA family protein n=1 Tax=Allofournierella sp. TaxID=1940256 RepID=UPI003AB29049